ncbi:response regulator [Limosilactobacillus sp. STM2_1]|uniref:Response regulator n=1 Tax=Limosilactobacillus rudii TaxID=2759755 RepID=A0A7W3UK36_9LACO|nr:response regulator [Limosilactobacillus rudii]MBB1079159.1 response regulator [Limosilactobacillus rudii]MBB1096966.1 response regulator [Limosilactobacillus rudii]MCD7133934.1 response regulator [Limosilactobacillus rudii]
MKVLLVDDEPLAREELHYLVQENNKVTKIIEAEGIKDAEEQIKNNQLDMVFLDIQLADGNGIAFAERIKKVTNSHLHIVFATAYDQYAINAFEADAVDYILKPFRAERINEAIERVAKLKPLSKTSANVERSYSPRLLIPNDERTIVLQKKRVLFIQASQGTLDIWTIDHHKITSKQTLANVLQQLDPRHFLQVHRSFVVNLDVVTELQPSFNHTYELTLSEGSKIPVSRSYVATTKRALGL